MRAMRVAILSVLVASSPGTANGRVLAVHWEQFAKQTMTILVTVGRSVTIEVADVPDAVALTWARLPQLEPAAHVAGSPYRAVFAPTAVTEADLLYLEDRTALRIKALPAPQDPGPIAGVDSLTEGQSAVFKVAAPDTASGALTKWFTSSNAVALLSSTAKNVRLTIPDGNTDTSVVLSVATVNAAGDSSTVQTKRLTVHQRPQSTMYERYRHGYYFTAGETMSREGNDFARRDTYFAFTADINLRDSKRDEAAVSRQFGQIDLRLAPVLDDTGKLSDKRAGLLDLRYYIEYGNVDSKYGGTRIAGSFDSFGSIGARFGVQSIPNDDQLAVLAAGFYRLSILEPRGSFAPPNVWAYLELGVGYWNQYDRATRVYVESRLQIPNTPFLFGFDTNLGGGVSDLRLLAALKTNINAFLSGIGFSASAPAQESSDSHAEHH